MSLNPLLAGHACRPECITPDDVVPQVSWPRYAVRRAGLVVTHGLIVLFGFLSVVLTPQAARWLRHVWARSVIAVTGITVEIEGEVPRSGPVLVTPNHVSFFDPSALLARFPPVVGIATRHIARNPVMGRLFRNCETIFVDGNSFADIPAMVRDATAALRAGALMVAYPEGAVRCMAPGGPFPPAVMQAAIAAGSPVQPVLMQCVLRDGTPTAQASWFPYDESLGTMLRRVLRIRGLVIRIRVFPAIDSAAARDRRELAQVAWAALEDATGPMPRTCVSQQQPTERSGHRAVAQ